MASANPLPSYEARLVDTMAQYSTHPAHPLRELEVFSGSILGNAQSKQVRSHAKDMNERFNRDVSAAVKVILEGDGDDEELDEALPRALACLEQAVRELGNFPKKGLESWRYVVAAVCLEELEKEKMKFGGGRLRGPPAMRFASGDVWDW